MFRQRWLVQTKKNVCFSSARRLADLSVADLCSSHFFNVKKFLLHIQRFAVLAVLSEIKLTLFLKLVFSSTAEICQQKGFIFFLTSKSLLFCCHKAVRDFCRLNDWLVARFAIVPFFYKVFLSEIRFLGIKI